MYPELEIQLLQRGPTVYSAVFRFRAPDSATVAVTEVRRVRIDPAKFDDDLLRADPNQYGLELGKLLFADPAARAAYDGAVGAAAGHPALRVRLATDQGAGELLPLRWELLRVPDPADPDGGALLAGTGRVFFSRHLASRDMREVRLRPKSSLSALVAVASPTDIGRFADGAGNPLSPIAVTGPDGALTVAEAGLAGLRLSPAPLVPTAGGPRVTLRRILAALREEPDILYLVCHGAMIDGEPQLLLEKEDGTTDFSSGDDFVEAFKGLRVLPRLVALISCQSGGDTAAAPGSPGAARAVLAAVGPRLAAAGVPAVLAMQGELDMATARVFLPAFFTALNKTGQVDEAVTAGRVAAAHRPDFWVPVLYTRLVEGRIWFAKGLAARADGAKVGWRALAQDIHGKKCVPILGSGVLEPFVGTTRDVARRLAGLNGYPPSLSGREDLPQVAQFLDTMGGSVDTLVQEQVITEMAGAVAERFPALGFGAVDGLDPGADLGRRLGAAWETYRAGRPFEPHQYLARMPQLTTIITTNPDDLMERALRAAGRLPQVHYCQWADDPAAQKPPAGPEGGTPRVFHLLGDLSDYRSITMTEDQYFQFLTANARRAVWKKVTHQFDGPGAAGLPDDLGDDLLRGALANSALLFLGFRVTDWDFRTLFRLLLDQNGASGGNKFTHVGVQVDPETGTHGDAVKAREYIERLFRELLGRRAGSRVAVYWGSVEDFLEDLDAEWKKLQPAAPAGGPA